MTTFLRRCPPERHEFAPGSTYCYCARRTRPAHEVGPIVGAEPGPTAEELANQLAAHREAVQPAKDRAEAHLLARHPLPWRVVGDPPQSFVLVCDANAVPVAGWAAALHLAVTALNEREALVRERDQAVRDRDEGFVNTASLFSRLRKAFDIPTSDLLIESLEKIAVDRGSGVSQAITTKAGSLPWRAIESGSEGGPAILGPSGEPEWRYSAGFGSTGEGLRVAVSALNEREALIQERDRLKAELASALLDLCTGEDEVDVITEEVERIEREVRLAACADALYWIFGPLGFGPHDSGIVEAIMGERQAEPRQHTPEQVTASTGRTVAEIDAADRAAEEAEATELAALREMAGKYSAFEDEMAMYARSEDASPLATLRRLLSELEALRENSIAWRAVQVALAPHAQEGENTAGTLKRLLEERCETFTVNARLDVATAELAELRILIEPHRKDGESTMGALARLLIEQENRRVKLPQFDTAAPVAVAAARTEERERAALLVRQAWPAMSISWENLEAIVNKITDVPYVQDGTPPADSAVAMEILCERRRQPNDDGLLPRRKLIRSAALILAEIERLDRKAAKTAPTDVGGAPV